MIEYVAGFLFSKDFKEVLLVEKLRPDWQRFKLNGIGGKIESGETPHQAMVREFQEEADLTIYNWEPVCDLRGTHSIVHFFATTYPFLPDYVNCPTDELIKRIQLNELNNHQTVSNLTWLLPLAIHALEKGYTFYIDEVNLQQ